MDGTFVEKFRDVVNVPHVETIDGQQRLLTPHGWQDATPRPPDVASLKVATLTSLVDYVSSNVDQLEATALIVHVTNPITVELRAKLEDEAAGFRRHTYLVASTDASSFPFAQFMEAEAFVIALQTRFLDQPERAELLTLVGSIREHGVKETVDDGYAQEVKVQQGVVFVGERKVPNPVSLAPYRTFREVAQPVSPFVLRLQSGKEGEKPKLALFEADGGAWKLQAIANVATYLRQNLAGFAVIA